MKAGQTLIGDDGKQVLLYPLPVLNVTQTSGPNSLSHCCGSPFDAVGQTANATLYAPCNCHKIYQGAYNGGNTCTFVSDAQVHTPAGVGYVTFQFTHGKLLGNGSTYKQGQPIYTTGTLGMATGDHVHIDQSLQKDAAFISSGITCAYGNLCYMLQGSTNPSRVFYINGTTVINSAGLAWKSYSGGHEGDIGGGETLDWIIPVVDSDPYNRSIPLTMEQMQNNAKCFYGYMSIKYGWSLNAICGILGNAQSESTINPNRWQGDYSGFNPVSTEGFGLVQWTPFTNITNWLKQKGYWGKFETYGNAECDKIQEELENNEQWITTSAYPMSFKEFSTSTADPGYLAWVFLANYERPADPQQPIRATQARQWYDFLKGWTPVLPGEAEGGGMRKPKTPFWVFMKPFYMP